VVTVRAYTALAAAGFRRFATYRQATFAGALTNVVFGFMRGYVLFSIAGPAGNLAGYDLSQLAAFVWLSQGLLAVVNAWGQLDLAERVRSGDVVADLLRPVAPMPLYLCTDLGRAGFAMLTRFVVPVGVGMLVFDFYLPRHAVSYLLFAISLLLALLVSFCARYLIGLAAFWLLDVRGLIMLWVFLWGAGSGLYFPLPLLPEWAQLVLWIGTPFPTMIQAPLDIAVERGGFSHAGLALLAQLVWLAIGLLACRVVQARAWRKLVVQGG
jgi:ABC-2 type transport system permease protein